MYRILSLGHVDLHSCQRVGLPEPNFSKFKVAFKAHVFNGHAGSAGHLVYLRQQMAKGAPDTTEVMEDMCERMFGGHETDMEERREWRVKNDHSRRADPKLLAMATAWLSTGATKGTLPAAQFEAVDAGARQAFSEGRGATQQKRKWLQGAERGWQGRNAHASHAPWAEVAASTLSPTHYPSWSFTRGQHTDFPGAGKGRTQPQDWAWGAQEDPYTAASSSSSHNAWGTQPPGVSAELAGAWAEGQAQQQVGWGPSSDAQAAALAYAWGTQQSAEGSHPAGASAGGEAQQEFAWGTFADAQTAASSSSDLNTWATQPSTTWDQPWWDGSAYPHEPQQASEPWYQ